MTRKRASMCVQQTAEGQESPCGLLKTPFNGTDSLYHFQREV